MFYHKSLKLYCNIYCYKVEYCINMTATEQVYILDLNYCHHEGMGIFLYYTTFINY